MPDDNPVAWVKTFGVDDGRVFYTNLGHNMATWQRADFQGHLLAGIEWVSEQRPNRACTAERFAVVTRALSRSDPGTDEKWRRRRSDYGPQVNLRPQQGRQHETTPILDQRHPRRLLRSQAFFPDEEMHLYFAASLERADALLFGRVTYEMMEEAWRSPAPGTWPDWMDDWMIPFAQAIDGAKKYVVSSTLARVDWNAELVQGDLGQAVQQLKQEPGDGLYVGGVTLPLALADLGLIDEYEFVVHPIVAGHGPTLFAGLSERLKLELVGRQEFGSGAVAQRYQPSRVRLEGWWARGDLNPHVLTDTGT